MTTNEEDSVALKYVVPLVLVLVGALGFLLLKGLKAAPASTQPKKSPPSVVTEEIGDRQDAIWIAVDGQVTPYREVTLSAEVAGRIESKSAECFAGHYVKQDTVLMQIDRADYELEVLRMDSLLKQSEIDIDELGVEEQNTDALIVLAKIDIELQNNELKRIAELHRRGVAPDSDLDTAKRNELNSRNTLQTLENQKALLKKRLERTHIDRKRIEAELDKAKLDLERTTVRAPEFNGVITEDTVEAGAFVQRGATLAKVVDTSKVEVHFDLQLDELQWLWQYGAAQKDLVDTRLAGSYELPPLPVTVSLNVNDQDFHWRGRLARYDGSGVNTETRTVPCIAVVDEPTKLIRSEEDDESLELSAPPALLRGMFVSIKIKIIPQVPLLSIPEAAVRPGNRVWIFRDEKLVIQPVDVVMTIENEALVVADPEQLIAGDRVITSPLAIAVNGMPLRLAKQSGEASKPTPTAPEGS